MVTWLRKRGQFHNYVSFTRTNSSSTGTREFAYEPSVDSKPLEYT